MKLISCYIDHFGRFSGESFFFGEGLTNICEKNGYGKTTLAAFLMAMFYGMEPTRKNGRFNDRSHYFPFTGGTFGGNVVFLYQGKTYKIERRFDETSDTRDLLTVYCDSELFEGFGAVPGEKIFGIDKESFERTVFLTAREVELSATDNIHTKLNNFVEGSEDDTRLQAALHRLEDRAKDYKKSRGSGGLIPEEAERIRELREHLKNGKAVREGLPRKYDALNEYQKEEARLAAEITAAQSENTRRAHWEQYDRIQEEAATSKATISAIAASYPCGLPAEAEVGQVLEAFAEREKGRARAEKTAFTTEDAAKYTKLEESFCAGLPKEDVLKGAEQVQKKLQELETRASVLRGTRESEEDAALRQRFSGHVPTEEELANLERDLQSYRDADRACQAVPEQLAVAAPAPAFAGRHILLAVLAGVVLLAGVALLFVQLAAGAALLVAGVLLLAADGFWYLNKKSGAALGSAVRQAQAPERVAACAAREDAAERIGAQLLPYGYTLDRGVPFAAERFAQELRRYAEFQKRAAEREKELTQLGVQITQAREELDGFFGCYGILEETDLARWARLRTMMSEYRSLQKRKTDAEAADRETRAGIRQAEEHIRVFFGKYRPMEAPTVADAEAIREDLRAWEREAKHLSEKMAEAEAFREEKKLEARPDGTPADPDELNRRLQAVNGEMQRMTSEILTDERDIERDDELQNELAAHEARLTEYKKQYDVLQKTMDMLRAADRKCKDKYIRPVREAFRSYSDVLEKALGERIVMDASFNVRFEANGRERNEAHLSAGQRSICAFCFRLALIDNMYAGEKPFLILDDPFAGLDEAHLVKVRALLTELARTRQMIYFSCHESRQM